MMDKIKLRLMISLSSLYSRDSACDTSNLSAVCFGYCTQLSFEVVYFKGETTIPPKNDKDLLNLGMAMILNLHERD